MLLDYAVWKKLMDQIEDMEDSAEIEASRTSGEETVPCEQAKAELRVQRVSMYDAQVEQQYFFDLSEDLREINVERWERLYAVGE